MAVEPGLRLRPGIQRLDADGGKIPGRIGRQFLRPLDLADLTVLLGGTETTISVSESSGARSPLKRTPGSSDWARVVATRRSTSEAPAAVPEGTRTPTGRPPQPERESISPTQSKARPIRAVRLASAIDGTPSPLLSTTRTGRHDRRLSDSVRSSRKEWQIFTDQDTLPDVFSHWPGLPSSGRSPWAGNFSLQGPTRKSPGNSLKWRMSFTSIATS
ncbi:hypothetical protein AOX55_00002753 [Sinorhizobium fredii CCBAU 25509]|nr:hypothetical protein AOX55_00002753 [Sinorhizobium fredii CCBAU 25509]